LYIGEKRTETSIDIKLLRSLMINSIHFFDLTEDIVY